MSEAPRREKFGKCVVAISGAGCLGKSTLAEALVYYLREKYNLMAAFIDLDGFLIEKAIREAEPEPISGYNPKGYELNTARKLLKEWIEHDTPIEVKIYDKLSSHRMNSRRVPPAKISIIEGACAFFEEFRALSNIKIFVDAPKQIQFENRKRRERFDLGRTHEEIVKKFQGLYPDYLKYIKPTKFLADVILTVDTSYQFRIDKMPTVHMSVATSS